MESQQVRKNRVAWALSVAQNIAVVPGEYEQKLLDKYVRGVLTLEEVILLLELREQATKFNGANI